MTYWSVLRLFHTSPRYPWMTMNQLRRVFANDITPRFQWGQQFYEQIDGVAMDRPLIPVVANFYIESCEKSTIQSAPLKPSCWFCHIFVLRLSIGWAIRLHGDSLSALSTLGPIVCSHLTFAFRLASFVIFIQKRVVLHSSRRRQIEFIEGN